MTVNALTFIKTVINHKHIAGTLLVTYSAPSLAFRGLHATDNFTAGVFCWGVGCSTPPCRSLIGTAGDTSWAIPGAWTPLTREVRMRLSLGSVLSLPRCACPHPPAEPMLVWLTGQPGPGVA